MKIDGVVHDNVVHAKKRVKVNGKFVWKPPSYVNGAQIMDRAWRFMKDRITLNQHCAAGSRLIMRMKIRNAQYLYWMRNSDLWVDTGKLCAWAMRNFA